MTDLIPTAAEAKDLADDCCEALAGLVSVPTTRLTSRHPITERILAEMQALNGESWPEAIGSPIKPIWDSTRSIGVCAFCGRTVISMRPLGLRLR
jgi:hypothetical protein